jgi:hypothetical protein
MKKEVKKKREDQFLTNQMLNDDIKNDLKNIKVNSD